MPRTVQVQIPSREVWNSGGTFGLEGQIWASLFSQWRLNLGVDRVLKREDEQKSPEDKRRKRKEGLGSSQSGRGSALPRGHV